MLGRPVNVIDVIALEFSVFTSVYWERMSQKAGVSHPRPQQNLRTSSPNYRLTHWPFIVIQPSSSLTLTFALFSLHDSKWEFLNGLQEDLKES